MIFFVLSGFFIGGSVFHKISDGTWGWGDYLANRLSRLWVVLIPALVLTFAFDEAGIFLTGGNGYNGEFNQMIHSGPMLNGRLDTGFLCFLSNLFFLQTIISPVFGSNGPLWSLCNEFWYYIIFPPLVFLFARNKKWMVRIFYFLILILLFCFLPRAIVIYGCIWFFGFLTFLCAHKPRLNSWTSNFLFFGVFFIFFALGFWLSKRNWPYSDFLIGASFAGMIPYLLNLKIDLSGYRWISEKLSEVSYTLYCFHFPFLCFLFFVYRLPHRSQPSPSGYLTYFIFFFIVLLLARGLWWMFERNTELVRSVFKRALKYMGRKN